MMRASVVFVSLWFAQSALAQVTVPYTFSAGTEARAAEVNADFTALAGAIDQDRTRLDAIDAVLGRIEIPGMIVVNTQAELMSALASGYGHIVIQGFIEIDEPMVIDHGGSVMIIEGTYGLVVTSDSFPPGRGVVEVVGAGNPGDVEIRDLEIYGTWADIGVDCLGSDLTLTRTRVQVDGFFVSGVGVHANDCTLHLNWSTVTVANSQNGVGVMSVATDGTWKNSEVRIFANVSQVLGIDGGWVRIRDSQLVAAEFSPTASQFVFQISNGANVVLRESETRGNLSNTSGSAAIAYTEINGTFSGTAPLCLGNYDEFLQPVDCLP